VGVLRWPEEAEGQEKKGNRARPGQSKQFGKRKHSNRKTVWRLMRSADKHEVELIVGEKEHLHSAMCISFRKLGLTLYMAQTYRSVLQCAFLS
jgi:hypothetical protein